MGMTAGGVGALIGTPAEVTLIRMTSDGRYGEIMEFELTFGNVTMLTLGHSQLAN
jgi:hypothetical protein